jgi:drug/metabolite transporter (DMT)-like permease
MTPRPLRLSVLLAFSAIYFLWGSTFLAIRVVVAHVPPLFAAGVRFLIAGIALYFFAQWRSKSWPTARQWRNLTILAAIMFAVNYGAIFWAEKYLPSGLAAVLVATIPLFTVFFETVLLKQEPFRWQLFASIAIGFCGVAVLMLHGGESGLHLLPCLAILSGSFCWSLGSVLSRSIELPASRPLTAGAQMMLGGFLLLLCSLFAGEMRPFPSFTQPVALALLYLIVFGSLVAFTAYVWLLSHMPATRVASYAYVNPVVALAIGHWIGGETVSSHTLIGTALVLSSVLVTLSSKMIAKQTSNGVQSDRKTVPEFVSSDPTYLSKSFSARTSDENN